MAEAHVDAGVDFLRGGFEPGGLCLHDQIGGGDTLAVCKSGAAEVFICLCHIGYGCVVGLDGFLHLISCLMHLKVYHLLSVLHL